MLGFVHCGYRVIYPAWMVQSRGGWLRLYSSPTCFCHVLSWNSSEQGTEQEPPWGLGSTNQGTSSAGMPAQPDAAIRPRGLIHA